MKNSRPLFLLNRPENEIDIFSQFLQIPSKLLLRAQFAKNLKRKRNDLWCNIENVRFYQIITIFIFHGLWFSEVERFVLDFRRLELCMEIGKMDAIGVEQNWEKENLSIILM